MPASIWSLHSHLETGREVDNSQMGGEEGRTRTKGETRGLSIPSSSQGKQFTRQDQKGLPGEEQGSEEIPLSAQSLLY